MVPAVERQTLTIANRLASSWFYFPQMTREEAILIKNYDTITDGRARYAPHTSFADPTSSATALPRESLETRVFAFFDD